MKSDNLAKYGLDFQIKTICGLVSDKSFIERIYDIIDADSFESSAHQWIVKEIVSYFLTYKELPTLTTFKVKINELHDAHTKSEIIDQLRLVYQKITDSDLKFIKEQYLEFCKNQKLKSAILESVDHLQNGEYEKIKSVVDEAMKAGMERNIGHNYMEEVDTRMSMMSRSCTRTNWAEIDTILDGGLAPGELGIIAAPAGIGKCVGPNTIINIQYHEIGVEITGNSGKTTLWISPMEKYMIDDKVLYGWQVENVFYELEKLKATSQPGVE